MTSKPWYFDITATTTVKKNRNYCNIW